MASGSWGGCVWASIKKGVLLISIVTSLGCVTLHSLPWSERHVCTPTTPRYLVLYDVFVANGSWGGCVGVNCGGSHAPISPLSLLFRYKGECHVPYLAPKRHNSRDSYLITEFTRNGLNRSAAHLIEATWTPRSCVVWSLRLPSSCSIGGLR